MTPPGPGRRSLLAGAAAALAAGGGAPAAAQEAPRRMGPLRMAPGGGRYFLAPDGRPLFLAGSHTWSNLQDMGTAEPVPAFAFDAHLDHLAGLGQNLTRLWTWDSPMSGGSAIGHVTPLPWRRTGPGRDAMGRPRFDLTAFDPAYFARLRARVQAARRRGIYVVVMLWNTWAMHNYPMEAAKDPWRFHPLAAGNNINGIDGDPQRRGTGAATQTLATPAVTAVQEAYMRRVVETVGDLDNILYEITNEPLTDPATSAWQRAMVERLRAIQARRGERHLIGVTGGTKPEVEVINAQVLASGADWVSLAGDEAWHADPPEADGSRVSLLDTDHVFGVGGDALWMWKAFCRGHNLLAMESFTSLRFPGRLLDTPPELARVEDSGRQGIRDILRLAGRLGMRGMAPRGAESSTGYLLADPGRAWVALAPERGQVALDLSAASGRRLRVAWIDVATGTVRPAAGVTAGRGRQAFEGAGVLVVTA